MKNLEVTKMRCILAVRKLRVTTLALSRDMARVAFPSSLTRLISTQKHHGACLSGFLWSDMPHLQDNYLTNHKIWVTRKRRAILKFTYQTKQF